MQLSLADMDYLIIKGQVDRRPNQASSGHPAHAYSSEVYPFYTTVSRFPFSDECSTVYQLFDRAIVLQQDQTRDIMLGMVNSQLMIGSSKHQLKQRTWYCSPPSCD